MWYKNVLSVQIKVLLLGPNSFNLKFHNLAASQICRALLPAAAATASYDRSTGDYTAITGPGVTRQPIVDSLVRQARAVGLICGGARPKVVIIQFKLELQFVMRTVAP